MFVCVRFSLFSVFCFFFVRLLISIIANVRAGNEWRGGRRSRRKKKTVHGGFVFIKRVCDENLRLNKQVVIGDMESGLANGNRQIAPNGWK